MKCSGSQDLSCGFSTCCDHQKSFLGHSISPFLICGQTARENTPKDIARLWSSSLGYHVTAPGAVKNDLLRLLMHVLQEADLSKFATQRWPNIVEQELSDALLGGLQQFAQDLERSFGGGPRGVSTRKVRPMGIVWPRASVLSRL